MRRVRWLPGLCAGGRTGCLLVALLIGPLLLVEPVAADGLVITAVSPQEQQWQVDAAVFSPSTSAGLNLASPPTARESAIGDLAGGQPAPGAAGEVQTYVVQRGDTLSQIAARFGIDSKVLAERNALKNPDHIEVGQVLTLGEPVPIQLSLPPDGDLVRVQMWPWSPVQGHTLAVWLKTRSPVSTTVRVGGSHYPVVAQGARGWALVPINALASPGEKVLTLVAGRTIVNLPIQVGAGVFQSYNVPEAVSRPILSQAAKVNAEAKRLATLFAGVSPFGWTPSSRFRNPLSGAYPHSSPYGTRRTYGSGSTVSAHEGEDFSAPPGSEVTAPAAGVVVLAEPLFVRGNAVILDHGHGVFTGYWHMQEIDVHPGERVEPGQLLGKVGSTGLSTGAHLHWEMHVNGVAVDPLQWLEK